MSKNVLIVESPAKAKTIEKFLGEDFKVVSSYGHIRDLPTGKMAIDTEKGYEPQYVIPNDKKEIVKQLKKIAKESEEVWLATDEDREGEAISWHLCEILELNPEKTKRIVFHEITKPAIKKAIENPRTINLNLVNAQQARRVLDRLVGFEVSPILWRKVSLKNALSAGRVQSVAVRLIVEREREIENFDAISSYKVIAIFEIEGENGNKSQLKAELTKGLSTLDSAREFLNKCNGAEFKIKDIDVKPAKKSPTAPFITSTLQQEASRKLGYSVAKTMLVAQKLYEAGKITYMRTDSVNLSETALDAAKATIEANYGSQYVQIRKYKTKSSGAQEAHEAIRPTDMDVKSIESNNDEMRLYELIWKRTISSQMSDAQLERTTVHIGISTTDEKLIAKGEVIKFDGFLKVYLESREEDNSNEDDGLLPQVHPGQILELDKITATERFSRPPARYTEASLVRKLEELGIGRPSTYAPTISTVQKRGYVEKTDKTGKERKYELLTLASGKIAQMTETEMTGVEKSKMFPTDIGILVTDFLVDHFTNIMDYNFTAQIEKQFDDIAYGRGEWNAMIHDFYEPFHSTVTETLENAGRVTGERELGTDPKSGFKVFSKMGKYGPMVQIGTTEDEERKFAKMKPDQHIGSISLEEAIELFNLPRTLGDYENAPVIASEGRYGPYIRYDGKFYSLKEHDPRKVTLEEAIEVIKVNLDDEKKKVIQVFEEESIQVLNGPYGAYIKSNKRNYKIPKAKKAEELTLEECQEIIENAPEPKKRFSKRGK